MRAACDTRGHARKRRALSSSDGGRTRGKLPRRRDSRRRTRRLCPVDDGGTRGTGTRNFRWTSSISIWAQGVAREARRRRRRHWTFRSHSTPRPAPGFTRTLHHKQCIQTLILRDTMETDSSRRRRVLWGRLLTRPLPSRPRLRMNVLGCTRHDMSIRDSERSFHSFIVPNVRAYVLIDIQ